MHQIRQIQKGKANSFIDYSVRLAIFKDFSALYGNKRQLEIKIALHN
jgi:hypothetical protein